MDNKLLNKVITISSKEEKASTYGPMVKIKDENNLTYTVFQRKQDGTTSTAWEQLQSLSLGSTVQIGYVEQPKTTPDGKSYMARTIRNFDKDIANGMQNAGGYQTPAPAQLPRSEANKGLKNGSNDAFGKRLALHGMVNGLLANPNMGIEDVKNCLPELVQLEEAINQALEAKSGYQQFKETGESLAEEPPIESYDDLASDIPF